MMPCCVSGCQNRRTSTSKLKFFKIPRGSSPLQAKRRRLWLNAIGEVNGDTEGLKGSARICAAHFMSGEQSLDPKHPDFVPSVFTCLTWSGRRKEKAERKDALSPSLYYGLRKKRRTDYTEYDEEILPSVDLPVDLESSVLIEEEIEEELAPVEEETMAEEAECDLKATSEASVPTPHELAPVEEDTMAEEAEFDLKATSEASVPTPHELAPVEEDTMADEAECDLKVTSKESLLQFHKIDNRIPIVRLISICTRTGHYQCEHCQQSFIDASELVKHLELHKDQKPIICEVCSVIFTNLMDFREHKQTHKDSFPCNMCNRFFPSSHSLKRHKLLHLRDSRKCRICGVLFCRRHNHILYLPLSVVGQDASISEEPQQVDSEVKPDSAMVKFEPIQTPILENGDQSNLTPDACAKPVDKAKTKYVVLPNINKQIISVYIRPQPIPPKLAPLIPQPEQPEKVVCWLKQAEQPKAEVCSPKQPEQPEVEVCSLKQLEAEVCSLKQSVQSKAKVYWPKQPEQRKAIVCWPKEPDQSKAKVYWPEQPEQSKAKVYWPKQPKQSKAKVYWPKQPEQSKAEVCWLKQSKQSKAKAYWPKQPEQSKAEVCWLKQPEPQKVPVLPPSLQMFSKQYLTSAFLKVKRNYKYILSKPEIVNKQKKKEEEEEVKCNVLTWAPPVEEKNIQTKHERIAYDMQIVL